MATVISSELEEDVVSQNEPFGACGMLLGEQRCRAQKLGVVDSLETGR